MAVPIRDEPPQWIELSDFSPGIHGGYHAGIGSTARGSVLRNGAATIDGTFRCCSDSSGALMPLPRRSASRQQSLIGTTTTPTFYPTNNQAMYQQDAMVTGKHVDILGGVPSPSGENVAVAWNFLYDPAGGSAYSIFGLVRIFRQWRTSPMSTIAFVTDSALQPKWDVYWQKTPITSGGLGVTLPGTTPPWRLMSMSMTTARKLGAGGSPSTQLYYIFSVAAAYTLTGAGAIPAAEQLLSTFGTDNTNGWVYPSTLNTVYNWPKASTGTPNTRTLESALGSGTPTEGVIGHQGRIIFVSPFTAEFGDPNEFWRNEMLGYNVADTLNGSGTSATFGVFGEENTSGTAFLASTTTDELFIMKHANGAILVRGDVDNPTVVRLPFVESAFGVQVHPATTPIGLVYGSRNGVFVWQGGETSQKLSPQIDGFFFQHEQDTTNELYSGFRGRMEWWHPWVLVPNNYLFDTNTKAWWRLEDPARTSNVPYNIYRAGPVSGKLYAFPYKLTTTQQTCWDEYDSTLLASSFAWRSQPLVESVEHVMSYQDIEIVASSGTGTSANEIIVTLTGFDINGAALTPAVVGFSFTGTGTTNGAPVILRKHITPNFNARYVQIKVESINSSGSDPAPKIHAIRVSHRPGARVQHKNDHTGAKFDAGPFDASTFA